MRVGTCEEVEGLIEREALGWSEADRLRVEQHLADCEACRETLALARFVRDTLHEAAGELSEPARNRAIQRALNSRAKSVAVHGTSKRWLGFGLAGSLAAAAAVTLVFGLNTNDAPAGKLVSQSQPKAAPQQELAAAPKPAEGLTPTERVEPAQQAPRWIETTAREQHVFAHAQVTLEPATRARFDAESTTLWLEHGRVDVDVDANLGKQFAVQTQGFRVEVLGTRFLVTPETVHVTRGRVQVIALDGRVLARELAAGATFSFGESAHKPHASASHSRTSVASKETAPALATTAPAKNASTWLAEARMALARGDSNTTRELVLRAEAARPQRNERAEAGTLRAEAALLDRDSASALRLYRTVSEHFPELAAGDNAAFAAAQLAARSDPEAARKLFESYLARFPNGRFRSEAQQRLARLKQ